MIDDPQNDGSASWPRPHDPWVERTVEHITDDERSYTVIVRKRSLRSKRRMFTIACTAFTLGALLIIFSSPYNQKFLSPGPLTSHHAQILKGKGITQCATCHQSADASFTDWIGTLFSTQHHSGITQSRLCMDCHHQTISTEFQLRPHSVDPARLNTGGNASTSIPLTRHLAFASPVHDDRISCGSCHREHQGAKFDLTTLTNQQCQSCHGNTFHSFESGHPEFKNGLIRNKPQISFNHALHSIKHFPSKGQAFQCSECHVDDPFHDVKRLAPFEQTCSKCHTDQIIDSGQPGLAIFALPMVDMRAIQDADLELGGWPLAATGDFDGAIPPIMKVLLSADPPAASILKQHRSDFEFADINPDDPQQVAQAVELVWAIKRLLLDLATNGSAAIKMRLETVLQVEISDSEIDRLVTNLDQLAFQSAAHRWIPNLQTELAARNDSSPAIAPTLPDPIPTASTIEKLESDQGSPPQSSRSTLIPKRTEPIHWKPEQLLLMKELLQDEILAVNPIREMRRKNGTSSKSVSPNSGDPPPLANKASSPNGPITAVPQPPTEPQIQPKIQHQIPSKSSDPFPSSNDTSVGWTRNDLLFRISYRLQGHADPCIQTWIELMARVNDAEQGQDTHSLFKRIMPESGIGQCRSCHKLNRDADYRSTSLWAAQFRDPGIGSSTRFSHAPHLIQPHLQDCSFCHAINALYTPSKEPTSLSLRSPRLDFLPMTKSQCATCHQKNLNGNGCTQCHDYHIGSRFTGLK